MGKQGAWIVAVDGPAGSGKSSICASACRRLDWTYINTGAIYRAVGLVMEQRHVGLADEAALSALIDEFNVKFKWNSQTRQLHFGEQNLTPFLNSEIAGKNASKIAKVALLREKLLPLQRQLANTAQHGVLLDGRDIGTVVFPDADLKIFMTAGLEQRAARRLAQLHEKHPGEELPSLAAIMADMAKRDQQDSQRGVAPLLQAPDATVFDTSELTIDESIDQLVALIRKRLLTPA